jgi:hypothetical protein
MLFRVLPLLAGLAPLIGISVAYWLGAQHEHLPNCNPWLDGCTSISSTGRYPPGDRVFRAVMLTQAAWLAVTWYLAAIWLRNIVPAGRADRTVVVAGLVGALALVVYVSYLASNDPFYEIMKHYGIYLYFAGTAVAQVAVSASLAPSRLQKIMLVLCLTPFVLGIFNILHKYVIHDINSMENRIEWIAALFMQLWFVTLFLAWRRAKIRVLIG